MERESEEGEGDVEPVGDDGGEEASDGVGEDGTRGEFAVVHRVEHGRVGAQEAAPAHADGREDRDGVAIDPPLLDELGHEAQGSAHSAEGGDGEADEVGIVEAEQELEDNADLLADPGQDGHALIGGTGILPALAGREGEDHHQRRDDDHAGDDGQTDIDASAAAVEQGVEDAQEGGLVLLVLGLEVLLGEDTGGLLGILGVVLLDEVLHQARRDDTAGDGADEADERFLEVAIAHHEDDDDEAHAEGGAEVGQRDILVLLEVGGEALVLGEGDDGGVVAQEGEHGTERGHAGEVEQGLHQGAQGLLEEIDDAELDKEAADGSGDDTHGHEEEAGVQQQVVGGVHDGVEHVGSAHLEGEAAEDADDDQQAGDAAELAAGTAQVAHVLAGEG